MREKTRVYVTLKDGVYDPQGEAIRRAIARLGFDGVEGVRCGRLIELETSESSAEAEDSAPLDIEAICQKLLANEVIENYQIEKQS